MTISLLRSLLLSCTMLTLTAAQIAVNIDGQPGGPPPMPVGQQSYTPSMIYPNPIALRAWPPTVQNRQSNPAVTVLKILSAYAPEQDEDDCYGNHCFDVSIHSSTSNYGDGGDLFTLQPSFTSTGWEVIFQGGRSNGDSDGYDSNSWNVRIEVSLNSGSVIPSRIIQVHVFAPENVVGCTDEAGLNHNPNANTDDGSCEFCYIVPNSEETTCDATGAVGIMSVTCSPFYLETGAAGVNLGCTECPDPTVQCCQNAPLHATSTTCSGGGHNDFNSVTCDTGYSESGSVAGGDLGCLNCATNYFLSQGLCHSCATAGITCTSTVDSCDADNVLLGNACHTCSDTKAAYQVATCSCSN